ncbi:MAG TPA: M28 family peptidase [Patescibacteria group bacterium]|nr:M28 family peptidase [Patescibacteria group bacterium]
MDNPYLDVDKKIMSEIYTSSEPMDNLKVLCDIHGSRFPGTPGDLGSVNYMIDKYHEYGIENAHYESFTIPGWRRGHATLEVTNPIKKEFDVISLPHSLSGEIEATLVDLGAGHVDTYEKRKNEIDGNVVMVSGATPLGMTRNLHRSEKYNRSVLAGAKGWIYVNKAAGFGPITGGITPIVPAIGISYEDGAFLQRLVERAGRVKVRIKTTDVNLDVTTYNVIADVEGESVDRDYVLTGSHYDGHDIAQGAMDPASGAVVVMEMARVLNMVKAKLKRRIRFLCFGAEETGLYGSYNYSAAHEGELADCRFMLNLDSAGGPGKKGVIFNDVPELESMITRWSKEVKSEMPYMQRVSPYSDHWPFFLKGVPTGSGGDPGTSMITGYGHTKYDTVDKVKLPDMRLASANYSRFLFRAANVEDWDVRRKTPEEVEAFIERMGYEETIALTDRLKAYVSTWDEVHPDTEDWLKRKSAW